MKKQVLSLFFSFFAKIDCGETTCLNSGNQKVISSVEVYVSELLTQTLDFIKLMKCICVFYNICWIFFPLIKAGHVQLSFIDLITENLEM